MKKIVLFAALAACSTPAVAHEIHVNIAGKSLPAIRTELLKAAQSVCDREAADYRWSDFDHDGCVDQSYRAAMLQVKHKKVPTLLALDRAGSAGTK